MARCTLSGQRVGCLRFPTNRSSKASDFRPSHTPAPSWRNSFYPQFLVSAGSRPMTASGQNKRPISSCTSAQRRERTSTRPPPDVRMCRYSVPQRMSFRRRTERRRLRSFLRSFPSVAFTKTGDPIIRPVNARSRSKRSSSRRARMVSKSSAARGRATIPPLFIGSLEFAQIRSRFRRLYPRNGLFGIAPFDVLL